MHRKLFWFLFSALVALLWSCGDDARYAKSSDFLLRQDILFIPESLYGVAQTEIAPTRRDTIPAGTSARLWGRLSLDYIALSQEEIDYYVSRYFWTVKGESQSVYGLEHSFTEPGIYEAALHAVDYFGDTLTDTITLYVDARTDVQLLKPSDGLNTVDPQASTVLEFRWSLSGVENWEKPNCTFFMATHPDSVWTGTGQQVSCYTPLQLQGPWPDSIYYWGVFAWTDTTSWNSAMSSVYHFRPLISGLVHARLRIALGLLRQGPKARAHIRLTSSLGYVLADTTIASGITEVLLDNLPATSQAKLTVQAPDFPDYPAETLSVALSAGALAISDTIWLEDSIPPLVWPDRQVVSVNDSLIFYVADQGAGLIAGTIIPQVNDSIVAHHISGNRLALPLPCPIQCKLSIAAEDYAGNGITGSYWLLARSTAGTLISGPFPDQYEGTP